MRKFASFVALGDSFTEGLGDPGADGISWRGWADRFAEQLARHRPGLLYANLAIRSKLVSEVLAEQVPAAVAMSPDLVSLAAGGNDLLRPRTDPDDLAATFEQAVVRLRAAGASVLIFTGFDPKAFPVLRLFRGKSAVLTMHIRDIAAQHDCLIADIWTMRVLTDRRLWTPDRLHLTPDGHRRVALLACEAAGVPADSDWRAPLSTAGPAGPVLASTEPASTEPASTEPVGNGLADAPATWLGTRWSDITWLTEHAAPYLSRRLHGIGTGDGVTAKRPELLPVDPMPAKAMLRQ